MLYVKLFICRCKQLETKYAFNCRKIEVNVFDITGIFVGNDSFHLMTLQNYEIDTTFTYKHTTYFV